MNIDLLDPASFAGGQPHEQFRWLRDHAPVYRHPEPDGPGFWELDASLFKRVQIQGRTTVEFRVDAFNVTNSVRWGNPGTSLGSSTFGQITGTNGGQRSLRFGGRLTF